MSIRSPESSSNDILDAVAAHSHASPHAVYSLVGAADRDLRAIAGFAGNGADFDYSLGDFRDFLLEQPLHQLRLRTAEDDLHAAAGLLDFIDRRPHALVGMMRFAGNLLALGEDCLNVHEGHGSGAAFVALNHAGDQLPLEFFVFVEEGVPLGLADLLDHHLLGRLSADPFGDFRGVHGHAVVGAVDGARLTVDQDDDVFELSVVFFGSRHQRRLDSLEDDLLVDILIAVDRVDDAKQLVGVHGILLSPDRETPSTPRSTPQKRPRRHKILRRHNLVGSTIS